MLLLLKGKKKKKSKAQRRGGGRPGAHWAHLGGAEMLGDPAHPLSGTLVLSTFSAELTLCMIKQRVEGVFSVKIQPRVGNQGMPGGGRSV